MASACFISVMAIFLKTPPMDAAYGPLIRTCCHMYWMETCSSRAMAAFSLSISCSLMVPPFRYEFTAKRSSYAEIILMTPLQKGFFIAETAEYAEQYLFKENLCALRVLCDEFLQ
jgi:hypothetical protein